jgi:hypothetical protein
MTRSAALVAHNTFTEKYVKNQQKRRAANRLKGRQEASALFYMEV